MLHLERLKQSLKKSGQKINVKLCCRLFQEQGVVPVGSVGTSWGREEKEKAKHNIRITKRYICSCRIEPVSYTHLVTFKLKSEDGSPYEVQITFSADGGNISFTVKNELANQ